MFRRRRAMTPKAASIKKRIGHINERLFAKLIDGVVISGQKKTILFLSVLSCVIALPALGELTDTDLYKIRLIIKEEIKEELKPIKTDIVSLKIGSAWMQGKLEGIEKQVPHATNVTYGLIALIVAAVAITQILIARRSEKDRTLEKQIEKLTQ